MNGNETRIWETYAPIAIPTCNRYQHLKACIESLAACTHAEKTELYISVDYPPDENYVSGWQKIKNYVQTIQGFKKVNLWIQERNLGPRLNSRFLKSKIYEKYSFMIFTEDDNTFAPAYLDYMNKMLHRFEKDPRIFSISGFSMSNLPYSSKIYKNYAMQPWGSGEWKDKACYLRELKQSQIYEKCSKNIFKIIKLYFDNKWLFCAYVKCLIRENNDPYLVDGTLTLLFYLLGYYSIFPTKSLVRNHGFDGSGYSCREGVVSGLDQVEFYEGALFEYDISQKIPISKAWYLPIPEWAKRSSKLKNDPLTYALYLVMGKKKYWKWRNRKGF